jgi:D-3-phosphoglycerate dehydrogenase / 2-oxoglutarate reductase
VNAARLALTRKPGTVLNFARAAIVDGKAVLKALDAGWRLLDHRGVITFPHLGASTLEAEENCAVMVVEQLRDFLQNGNIRNSVNYPEAGLPRVSGTTRLAIANRNVPNMVGQISTALAAERINIADLLNKSCGEYAYTIIDLNGELTEGLLERIGAIDGVLAAYHV